MRRTMPVLLCLLFLLSMGPQAGATGTPLLFAPASRSLLINLISTDGTPIPDAEVHLLTPGLPGITGVRTNERGQATLSLPDGFSFWLRVWANDHALIERPYLPASDGPVLTLQAAPYTALLTGVVRDQRGLPVGQAQISLFREGYGLEATAMTSDLGIYTLRTLRADGSYTLQLQADGYQPISQTVSPLDPHRRNQVDLTLTPAIARVTGEVVDSQGNRPVGGVRVELLLNGWGPVGRATTDGLGYFSLTTPPLENGLYRLRLSRHDYETTTTATFGLTPGGWTDYSGSNRFSLNQLYAQMSGKLFDADANPLADVEVHLQREGLGTVETATTDEAGRFRFSQIPSGVYRVRAFPKTNLIRADTGWVSVTGGQVINTNIVAEIPDQGSYGSETLSGTVKNHQGAPVEGAQVTVHRGTQTYTAVTDAEGRYDVSLEATTSNRPTDEPYTGYHVMVSAEGYLLNDQPTRDEGAPPSLVEIRDNADNQASFVLQPEYGSVAGRVLDDQGRVLEGVAVGLMQEGRNKLAETVTDKAGGYLFDNLPIAKQLRYLPVVLDPVYVVGSVNPEGAPVEPSALSPANPTNVTLVARPASATFLGLVQAGTDRAAEGALVTVIRPADGRSFQGQVDADGSYQIKAPATPGEQYLVRTSSLETVTNAAPEAVTPGTNFGVQVNLTTHVNATITGRVFGSDGRPYYGARVMLYEEGSSVVNRITVTDAFGQYRFANLVPGRRYAVVASDGWMERTALSPAETVITPLVGLPSGETVWADLKLNAVSTATP